MDIGVFVLIFGGTGGSPILSLDGSFDGIVGVFVFFDRKDELNLAGVVSIESLERSFVGIVVIFVFFTVDKDELDTLFSAVLQRISRTSDRFDREPEGHDVGLSDI